MTFITSTGYDTAAIMRDAHRRAKKMRQNGTSNAWREESYAEVFSFYLAQVWITAQHEHRARLCTGATVTVAKAFDNGNSPLWRM
jgi:hypothetical protein